MRVGSLNTTGALVTGTTAGNIRITGTRTYSGSRVIYNGTSAQFIGSGHPNSTSPGLITEIDNPNHVTFNANTAANSAANGAIIIPGNLILTQGNLVIASSVGVARTLFLTSGVTPNTNFISVVGPSTNITIAGSGNLTFPSPAGLQTVGNLTVTRPGNTVSFPSQFNVITKLTSSGNVIFNASGNTFRDILLNNGSIDFNGSVSVTGFVSLANSTLLMFEGQTFSLSGNFTNNGGLLSSNGSSSLSLTGSTALTSPLAFMTGSALNTLSLNKSNSGTSVILNSPLTLTNALNLTAGTLSIVGGSLSINSGATITKSNTGSITSSSPSGGPWNVVYIGTSQNTGLEIPTSGLLNNLTVSTNSSTTITLTQNVTANGSISIPSSRTLLCGANNVSVGSFTNAGTFNAPTSSASTGLTVSGNFNNNGIYNHNNGTIIFNGTSSLTGISQTNFNQLTITGTLNTLVNFGVAGNFTNNGSFNGGAITVTFNGTSLQNLSGTSPLTTFQNISITNGFSPVSVSVESNINLVGILTLGASAKLDADGSADAAVFTLLSTNDSPAVDASIAPLPASASVLGNVTVQRFFRPSDNFDRFFSSPVSNGSVSQLQASVPSGNFPVTGGFAGTSFPCTGCNSNSHSLRYYREADAGIINRGYTAWVTSNASTLVPGVGYDAYMWNSVSNTTASLRGTINRGSINLGVVAGPPSNAITHTSNGVPSADGWNLVGNPYPSAIQWNNGAGWSKTNIDPTVWVWDVVGRVWHSYNANTSVGDLTNGIIASGQGFWVFAPTPGSASITINEQAKSVAGSGSYYRESKPLFATLKMSLNHKGATDNAFLVINENATPNFDVGFDAYKLELGIEQLGVSFQDETGSKLAHYAINRTQDLGDVPISIYAETEGEFSVSFSNENEFQDYERYYLIDSYLGVTSKISDEPYQFVMTSSNASRYNRFYLSVKPQKYQDNEFSMKLTCYPNPTSDKLTLEMNSDEVKTIVLIDEMGRVLNNVSFRSQKGITHATVELNSYRGGIYFVKVFTAEKIFIEKVIKY